jgi:putative toxin-antitoxin system antitoxin component (TIGR02293 family)
MAKSKPKPKTGFLVSEPSPSHSYSIPSARSSGKKRDLGHQFGLTLSDFADVLEVTPKTLSRWKQKGEILSRQQSDRIAILESLFILGERVLGSRQAMKDWIQEKVLYLNGDKPLDLLKTESGRRAVEEALHQIEFGMY